MARHSKYRTPYRVAYEKELPANREAFIAFLKKVRYVLNHINRAGGAISYVLAVLTLIRDEELCYPSRHSGRYVPYPWEFRDNKTLLLSEIPVKILKRVDDKFVELDINEAPDFLTDKMKDYVKCILTMRAGEFAKSISNVTCGLIPFLDSEETYIVKSINTEPCNDIDIGTVQKSNRGRKGEPQSNVAMYLLYRYFKRIKLRGIHQAAATLCNEFSSLFFRPGIGAPLIPENVRKRIQWTGTQRHLVEYAERFRR